MVSVLTGRDEDKFMKIEDFSRFPSEEEIERFGKKAVKSHLKLD
jgi:hypothetical protein